MKEENKDWNYKYIEYDNPKKVKINQIVGKVKFKIPYLGYPSIYLKELFDKNKTKPIVETGK